MIKFAKLCTLPLLIGAVGVEAATLTLEKQTIGNISAGVPTYSTNWGTNSSYVDGFHFSAPLPLPLPAQLSFAGFAAEAAALPDCDLGCTLDSVSIEFSGRFKGTLTVRTNNNGVTLFGASYRVWMAEDIFDNYVGPWTVDNSKPIDVSGFFDPNNPGNPDFRDFNYVSSMAGRRSWPDIDPDDGQTIPAHSEASYAGIAFSYGDPGSLVERTYDSGSPPLGNKPFAEFNNPWVLGCSARAAAAFLIESPPGSDHETEAVGWAECSATVTYQYSVNPAPVPPPITLLGVGLLAFAARRRLT